MKKKALEYFKQCSLTNKRANERIRELSTKLPPTPISPVEKSLNVQSPRFNQEQQKMNNKSNLTRVLADIAESDFWSAVAAIVKPNLVDEIMVQADIAYDYVSNLPAREDDMTIDEMAAICLYTLEWRDRQQSFYFVVNQYLREPERDTQHFYPLIKLIISGLQKTTPFNGTAWRAFNGVTNVSSLYNKGQVVCWNAFTSCSSDVSVCGVNFFAGGGEGENTLFNIQVTNSYSISQYSTYPTENEILLLPGSKFKVVDVLKASNSLSVIQLQQV